MVADSVVAWGVEVMRVASKNVKINQEDAKADLGNCIVSTTFHSFYLFPPFQISIFIYSCFLLLSLC